MFTMSWEQLRKKQPRVVKILINSINKNRLAHAYIFAGDEGTGKKDVALQLAKVYFCEKRIDENPCGVCSHCKRIDSFNHPDLHIIAPDGFSIKKEQVLYLQKEFSYLGMESRKKFYIVEQAEKMTQAAANSLLKFLEEPLSPTIAVLLTDTPQQILKTIESRSQILSFTMLSQEEFMKKLEQAGVSLPVARTLAAITSNFEAANRLCQEDWIVQARNLVIQLTEEVHLRPQHVLLTLQEKWLPHFNGKDFLEIGLDLLLIWYRDLLYTQLGEKSQVVFIDQIDQLEGFALIRNQRKIFEHMTAIFEAKKYLRANANPQLLMEKLLLTLQEGS